VVPTAEGCSVSVRFEWLGPTRPLDPTLRPALARYGELLLGIVTLVAREPVRVVAGAIVEDGRVLVARRRTDLADAGDGAGRWELPGGKVQPAESDEEALERELLEELGLRTVVRERIGPMVTVRPGVQLVCYRADRIGEDDLVLADHDQVRWVDAAELARVDLLDADREFIAPLRAVFTAQS
jgi:8-oxo-dGTP diphosphatase